MAERGRYRTKQQKQILDGLKKQDAFLTVEQLIDYLRGQGLQVGQTTVYRALDRLTQDGLVIKIPSVNGSKAQYRYLGEEVHSEPGKLVCLNCGHVLPLKCDMLDRFAAHIRAVHGFSLAGQYLILYGYCGECRQTTAEGNPGFRAAMEETSTVHCPCCDQEATHPRFGASTRLP